MIRMLTILAAAACFLAAAPAMASDLPALQAGVKIEAGGSPIDANIGHLVPCVTDWDGDGRKDLIVGLFERGKIRFYRNTGTDSAPAFEGFEFLKSDGKDISLPAG